MEFKTVITAGELLQMVSFLVAVFAAYNRLSVQLTKLETMIAPLWDQYTHTAHYRQHNFVTDKQAENEE